MLKFIEFFKEFAVEASQVFDVSADPFLMALCVCFCVCTEGLRRLSSIYRVGQWQD